MLNTDAIILDLSPVGVKILSDELPDPTEIDRFKGVSYCQAVLRATFGREVIIGPESIQVCQWAPVALGLKDAENEFERTIRRRFPPGTGYLYLAPIVKFDARQSPDVVIIRARPEVYKSIIAVLGYDSFIPYQNHSRDETALAVFAEGRQKGFSQLAIRNVNRWLNWMNGFASWQRITTLLFKSTAITMIFDRFITKYMANMSICRNSTVIPYQTGRANISFFCTGGIAWGKNLPDFLTSGFPYETYKKIESRLRFPGLPGYDHTQAGSDKIMDKMLKSASKIKGCAQ